ncbi:MAG: hypothetical protein K2Y37_19415 [Pirellulales bacterium]|nr:hypothetical protein [Pirellulales bacterium]
MNDFIGFIVAVRCSLVIGLPHMIRFVSLSPDVRHGLRAVCAALLILAGSTSIAHADPYVGLHSFNGLDGELPVGQLLPVGSELWGTTAYGGGDGVRGVLFSINPDGSNFQVRHGFTGANGDGVSPSQGVVQSGSRIFGMTAGQSFPAVVPATLYSINADGSDYQTIHTFPSFVDIGTTAVTTVGSKLYGVESLGSGNPSKAFAIDFDGSNFEYLHSFDQNTDGLMPLGRLLAYGDRLYGTTSSNGALNGGTVFSMSLDGSNFQVLHSFVRTPSEGSPFAGLTMVGSVLYGTTTGSAKTWGTLFSMNLDGSNFQTIHEFDGITSAFPIGELVEAHSRLFGTTFHGNGLNGSVYSIGVDGSDFKVLSKFEVPSAPREPASALTLLGSTLYGTTTGWSSSNTPPDRHGTVFAVPIPEASTFVMSGMALGSLIAVALRRRRIRSAQSIVDTTPT